MYTLSAQREPIRETKSRIEGYPTKRAACEASPKGTSERQVKPSPCGALPKGKRVASPKGAARTNGNSPIT